MGWCVWLGGNCTSQSWPLATSAPLSCPPLRTTLRLNPGLIRKRPKTLILSEPPFKFNSGNCWIDKFSGQCTGPFCEPLWPSFSVFNCLMFQPSLLIFKLLLVSWQSWPLTWPVLQLPPLLLLRKNEWF